MRSDIEVSTTVECAQAWERKCVYLILVNLDCIRSFKQSTYDQRRHKHPLVFVLYKCRVVTIFAKSYFSNYLFIKYGNCLLFSLSIYLSIYLSPPLCILLCWRHCYTHTYILSKQKNNTRKLSLTYVKLVAMLVCNGWHWRWGCGAQIHSRKQDNYFLS